jgi:hypothetical protein
MKMKRELPPSFSDLAEATTQEDDFSFSNRITKEIKGKTEKDMRLNFLSKLAQNRVLVPTIRKPLSH